MCGPTAQGGPGGIVISSDSCSMYNCTIVGNTAGAGGIYGLPGGVAYSSAGVPLLSSCICWYNAPGNVGRMPYTYGDDADSSYSNIQGWGGAGHMSIDAPPQFNLADGTYRLQPSSPCVDAGMPGTLFGGFYAADRAGRPRVVGGRMDMGAHEYASPLGGTPGGLHLSSTVDGMGAGLDAKVAPAGDDLIVALVDFGSILGGAVPVLLGQVFLDGTPPAGVPAYSYRLDPAHTSIFWDGNAQPGPLIGATPIVFGPATVPPGLDGLVLRLQGFALTPAAVNGFFASTRAIDHHFHD